MELNHLVATNAPSLTGGKMKMTKLLLHCDGADASTTFTDSSHQGHAVTASGNAQLDTAQKKFGTASALFDGTEDYISIANSNDWYMGLNAFTIDFWIRFSDSTVQQGIFAQMEDSSNGWALDFQGIYNELVFYTISDGSYVIYQTAALSPTNNTWYHIAIIRGWGGPNGWAITVDGTASTTFVDSSPILNVTGAFTIGGQTGLSNRYFAGWIDEFRILKGRPYWNWTTDFTPPTSAYDDLSI